MQLLEKSTTRWQTIEIWTSGVEVEFRVEGAVCAWFHRDKFLTGLAWDMIAAGALLGKPAPRSILMLGLAGGTAFRILRHLLPEAQLAAVDIDGELITLARRHMPLDDTGVEIHVADAYEWIANNPGQFDVVIDDVYLAGKTDVFRPHSWNPAILNALASAVADDGVLAVNLVTGAGHRKMQTLVRRQLAAHFPRVRAVRSPHALNEVLVAGRDVATRTRLRPHAVRFADPSDRTFWRSLDVRNISPQAGRGDSDGSARVPAPAATPQSRRDFLREAHRERASR